MVSRPLCFLFGKITRNWLFVLILAISWFASLYQLQKISPKLSCLKTCSSSHIHVLCILSEDFWSIGSGDSGLAVFLVPGAETPHLESGDSGREFRWDNYMDRGEAVLSRLPHPPRPKSLQCSPLLQESSPVAPAAGSCRATGLPSSQALEIFLSSAWISP